MKNEKTWFKLAQIAVYFLGYLALEATKTSQEASNIIDRRIEASRLTLKDTP